MSNSIFWNKINASSNNYIHINFYHNYITKKKIVGELKKYQQKKNLRLNLNKIIVSYYNKKSLENNKSLIFSRSQSKKSFNKIFSTNTDLLENKINKKRKHIKSNKKSPIYSNSNSHKNIKHHSKEKKMNTNYNNNLYSLYNKNVNNIRNNNNEDRAKKKINYSNDTSTNTNVNKNTKNNNNLSNINNTIFFNDTASAEDMAKSYVYHKKKIEKPKLQISSINKFVYSNSCFSLNSDKTEKSNNKKNIIEEKQIFFDCKDKKDFFDVNKMIKINKSSANKKKNKKRHNKSAMEINNNSPSKNSFYRKFGELFSFKNNL